MIKKSLIITAIALLVSFLSSDGYAQSADPEAEAARGSSINRKKTSPSTASSNIRKKQPTQGTTISEADLKAEYDILPQNRKSYVKGQEIVLRIHRPELNDEVRNKANQLVRQLRQGGDRVSEGMFAQFAKDYSENLSTGPFGGCLKGSVRENPNNLTDPYQALIRMKPGEITDPIHYQGRYFILRRGEQITRTFEEMKIELEVSLRNRRAYVKNSDLFSEAEQAWVPFWTRFCASIKAKNKVSFQQMISDDFDSDFLTNSDVWDNRDSFLRKLVVNNNRGWKRLGIWIEERRKAYYDVNGNQDRNYPRKGVFKDGGYYMEFGFFEGSWFLTTFYFADRV